MTTQSKVYLTSDLRDYFGGFEKIWLDLEGIEWLTATLFIFLAVLFIVLGRIHIVPRIGNEKLAKLTTPRINAFRDELLAGVKGPDGSEIKPLSRALAKKVLTSLKATLKDAKRRGNVAQNVASDVTITNRGRTKKLEVGTDKPTRGEIQRIVDAAEPGKGRTLLLTAALTGMRASELRGLRWSDVDLNGRQIHVRQRADHWRKIGQPKSAAGARTIPIGDMVVNTLRE